MGQQKRGGPWGRPGGGRVSRLGQRRGQENRGPHHLDDRGRQGDQRDLGCNRRRICWSHVRVERRVDVHHLHRFWLRGRRGLLHGLGWAAQHVGGGWLRGPLFEGASQVLL